MPYPGQFPGHIRVVCFVHVLELGLGQARTISHVHSQKSTTRPAAFNQRLRPCGMPLDRITQKVPIRVTHRCLSYFMIHYLQLHEVFRLVDSFNKGFEHHTVLLPRLDPTVSLDVEENVPIGTPDSLLMSLSGSTGRYGPLTHTHRSSPCSPDPLDPTLHLHTLHAPPALAQKRTANRGRLVPNLTGRKRGGGQRGITALASRWVHDAVTAALWVPSLPS